MEREAQIIEAACIALNNMNTRLEAEKVLMSFRSSERIVEQSVFILKRSNNFQVQFQVLAALKEYVLMSVNEDDVITEYLLVFVVQKDLQSAIISQALHVLAIIMRRRWNDLVFERLLHLNKVIGVRFINAVVLEFAGSSDTFKADFEKEKLLMLFEATLKTLEEALINQPSIELIGWTITAIEPQLSWEFTSELPNRWRLILLDPSFLTLLISVYDRFSHAEQIRHLVGQTMVSVASPDARTFETGEQKRNYAHRIIVFLISKFSQNDLILFQMTRVLIETFRAPTLATIEEIPQLVDRIAIVLIQMMSSNEIKLEQFDCMMDAFSLFIHQLNDEYSLNKLVSPSAIALCTLCNALAYRIFEAYLHCHFLMNEEIDDYHEIVGQLGRYNSEPCSRLLLESLQTQMSEMQFDWLLNVSGYLLADDPPGEVPEVPLCFCDNDMTKKVAVLVISTIIEDYLRRIPATDSHILQHVLWFVGRVSKSFLFSPNLGISESQSEHLLTVICSKVLDMFSTQTLTSLELMEAVTKTISQLASNRGVCKVLATQDFSLKIIEAIVDQITSHSYQELMHLDMLVESLSRFGKDQEDFLQSLFHRFFNRLNQNKRYFCLFEMLSGMASIVNYRNQNLILSLFRQNVFPLIPRIIEHREAHTFIFKFWQALLSNSSLDECEEYTRLVLEYYFSSVQCVLTDLSEDVLLSILATLDQMMFVNADCVLVSEFCTSLLARHIIPFFRAHTHVIITLPTLCTAIITLINTVLPFVLSRLPEHEESYRPLVIILMEVAVEFGLGSMMPETRFLTFESGKMVSNYYQNHTEQSFLIEIINYFNTNNSVK